MISLKIFHQLLIKWNEKIRRRYILLLYLLPPLKTAMMPLEPRVTPLTLFRCEHFQPFRLMEQLHTDERLTQLHQSQARSQPAAQPGG